VAATTTRRRKAAKTKAPTLGKTTWAIVTPVGVVLRENSYGAGAILALAQQLLGSITFATDHDVTELTIERRDLFGSPAPLYRVVRKEDGNVDTEIISEED
jgi:hypothetical protein